MLDTNANRKPALVSSRVYPHAVRWTASEHGLLDGQRLYIACPCSITVGDDDVASAASAAIRDRNHLSSRERLMYGMLANAGHHRGSDWMRAGVGCPPQILEIRISLCPLPTPP